MEIKQVWDILVRRKWLIVQGFVVIFGIILVATLLKPKTYFAECKLVVESEGTQEALLRSIGLESISEILFSANMSQQTAMAEVEVMRMMSKPVLDKVSQKLDLREADGSYTPGPALILGSMTFQWTALRGVKIKPSKKSPMYIVQGYSANPQESLDLSNTLAEVYLAEDIARKHRETSDAARFADEQAKLAKRDWNEAKRKLREFQTQEGIVDISMEVTAAIDQMAQLRAQRDMMGLSMSEISAMDQNFQGESGQVGGATISGQSQIGYLRSQLAQLESDLQGNLSKYTDSHPTIIALHERIIELQKKLIQEKDNYELTSVARASEIEKQIRQYENELSSFPDKLYTLAQLQLTATTSESLYKMLLEMKYKMNVTKAMQLSNISIIEPAWKAKIHSPSLEDNLMIGAILGLIFGLGLAILIEYLDDSVKDAESVQTQLGLPLL
ncbi:hypothetical protein KKA08_03690, partial [bacterium]|nr:hypothetical protein [bacterium]